MALNIKDPETDRLARELASATGESITIAIKTAIEERLARQKARNSVRAESDALLDLVGRGRARAVLDSRPAEEILAYDENGLPA